MGGGRVDDKWERKRGGMEGKREVDETIRLQSGWQWDTVCVWGVCVCACLLLNPLMNLMS